MNRHNLTRHPARRGVFHERKTSPAALRESAPGVRVSVEWIERADLDELVRDDPGLAWVLRRHRERCGAVKGRAA